jgi:hypothetical protein
VSWGTVSRLDGRWQRHRESKPSGGFCQSAQVAVPTTLLSPLCGISPVSPWLSTLPWWWNPIKCDF